MFERFKMVVSIQHVADRAGVSKAAVSMALKDHPDISKSRCQQIKRIAQEMGYQPNALARGLSGGRTQTIGILWAVGGPHATMSVVEKVSIRGMKHGYVSYIANSLSDPTIIMQTLNDFVQRRVDGVVLQWGCYMPLPNDIKETLARFPAAVVVTVRELESDLDQIIQDRLSAIREVVDHFARIQRRHPVYLTSRGGNESKIDAFMARARERNLRVSDHSLIELQYDTIDYVARKCQETLDQRYPQGRVDFDALVCSFDEGAAAAVQWLNRHHLKVPEDVALVGFNNSEFAQYAVPPIASVDRRDSEVVDVIDRMLFARLTESDLPPQREHIPMKFIWRESAG